MKIQGTNVFFLLLLLSGCGTARPVQPPLAAQPVVTTPTLSPAVQTQYLAKPISWKNSDIYGWSEQKFAQPGDQVEILSAPGRVVKGLVLKSGAQTRGKNTNVNLVLDTNSDRAPDTEADFLIETSGEIQTRLDRYEE